MPKLRDTKINWEHVYLYVCLSIITAAYLVFGYWNFYPEKVITFKNPQSISVDKSVYHAGDRITYKLDYCKTNPITGIVSRAIVDGFRLTYSPVQSSLEEGCHIILINDLVIPDFLPSGTYHLNIVAEYQVNPIKKFIVNLATTNFEVANASNDAVQLDNHEQSDQQKFQQLQDQLNKVK